MLAGLHLELHKYSWSTISPCVFSSFNAIVTWSGDIGCQYDYSDRRSGSNPFSPTVSPNLCSFFYACLLLDRSSMSLAIVQPSFPHVAGGSRLMPVVVQYCHMACEECDQSIFIVSVGFSTPLAFAMCVSTAVHYLFQAIELLRITLNSICW